jgi:hypothetical protein
MNHCMNCSEAMSFSSRSIRSSPGVDAGDRDLGVGVEEVLHHHHRVVALLDRRPVENAAIAAWSARRSAPRRRRTGGER